MKPTPSSSQSFAAELAALVPIVERFSQKRVLVVGDLFLDENIYGAMTGVSIEAPVPVFEVHERRHNPGAAGNTACNAAALGASTLLVSYVGDDSNAALVQAGLRASGVDTLGLTTAPQRPTNTYGKLRAACHHAPPQEILRADTPRPSPIEGELERAVIAAIERLAPGVDAIIVTDQVGSVATDRVLGAVAAAAREAGIPAVGDSRGRAHLFSAFTALTPNEREAMAATGRDTPDDAAMALAKRAERVFLTRGRDGIRLFERGQPPRDFPAMTAPRDVADVTGAGDTVTAVAGLALACGATSQEAALLANAAAALAVRQAGVVPATQAQLLAELAHHAPAKALYALDELAPIVMKLQAEGRCVVWTNGVFDLMHAGHAAYLERAAAEGDVLIVGMNSDASTRRIKGAGRPILPAEERAAVLTALRWVDYTTVFDTPDTVPCLERLKPDVYAKGGDYTIDTINQDERRVVEGYGGRIALLPGVEGRSTTNIIAQIRAAAAGEEDAKG